MDAGLYTTSRTTGFEFRKEFGNVNAAEAGSVEITTSTSAVSSKLPNSSKVVAAPSNLTKTIIQAVEAET